MRAPVPLLLCVLLTSLAACQREAAAPEVGNEPAQPTDVAPPSPPAPAAPATGTAPEGGLTLVTAGVAQPYVGDASNRALYYVEGDVDGSKCTGVCKETWPPVLVESAAPGVTGALTGSVATIQRADGGTQVTYNGHPLYRYAGDASAGRTSGHGVQDQWGHWFGLAADGSALPETSTPATGEAPTVPEPTQPGS